MRESEIILNYNDYQTLIHTCDHYIQSLLDRIIDIYKINYTTYDYQNLYIYHPKKGKVMYSINPITSQRTYSFYKEQIKEAKKLTKELRKNKDMCICMDKVDEIVDLLDEIDDMVIKKPKETPIRKKSIFHRNFRTKKKEKHHHFNDIFDPNLIKYSTKIFQRYSQIDSFKIFNEEFITKEEHMIINDVNNTLLKLQDILEKTDELILYNTDFIFDGNKLFSVYKNRSLKDYDLSKIDFDNKNISGIDISENKNVYINFDKIVKDLSDANISGYDLKKI